MSGLYHLVWVCDGCDDCVGSDGFTIVGPMPCDGDSKTGAVVVYAAEYERLLSHAAAALERADVGDAEEATAILRAVVNLDGTPVARRHAEPR